MYENVINVIAITITVAIPLFYVLLQRSKEHQSRVRLGAAQSAGLIEPASLHPKIDPERCIGTSACVAVCPEGEILGLVNGRAMLVSPSKCIGHGACAAACPMEAVALVFGTERRGVEIPHVKETFETNVAGLYIAGELGGMGLIRNAITQGREAVTYLAKTLKANSTHDYQVAIIGAGPAGLAATLQAHQMGLRYLTLEQDDVGGAILTYPRQKLVMTQPMEIPLYGKFKAREIQKEDLLELWNGIVKKTGIRIRTHEKMEGLEYKNGGFLLNSSQGSYTAQRVILAIGRRGTPRKLGMPGEDSAKVAYKLIEPEQYCGRRVLVVGGGDSAVEAALALAEQSGTKVTLSYRKKVFSRLKDKNRERIEQARLRGAVRVLFDSVVTEIQPDRVFLDFEGKKGALSNDYVLVFAGGELPTRLLQSLGVRIEMKFGER